MNATQISAGRREPMSRRGWLRAGLLGPMGLSLAEILRLRGLAAPASVGPARRAEACILVWLGGGPSHIDTFDPKPDAPAEIRGEFAAIQTRVPGVFLSELLPGLAARLDRFALVRSLTSPEADHDRASHHMLTGYRPSPSLVYPSLGSAVSKLGEPVDAVGLPSYVAIPQTPPFGGGGYLTRAYDPFAVESDPGRPGFRVRHLTPPDRVGLARLERRRAMVADLDAFAAEMTSTNLTLARDRFSQRAFELLTSEAAARAFALEEESDAIRDRYGRTSLGQSCLLARRLVERGVLFVTVNDLGGGPLGWDTHAGNFAALRERLAPPLDQAITALLDDLESRGMLETTLVLVLGEFGRTPKVNPNAGRDHHPHAHAALLAGGRIRVGQVVGATDERADRVLDRPVTPGALAATVFTALGIDPQTQLLTAENQPIRLVGSEGPITELLL
ncbi:MAG: hypothetical protein KatS3mg108_2970 [Isosphaeraceae bacterium]|jgi:hypothetical protein|nr:MAG: hypothetical protein KatS3mg108_2970 [Isosphaeraceae bacterium]